MITRAAFLTAFPAFRNVAVAVIDAAIGDAAPFFEDPDRYGDFLASAQGYCVAHFAVLRAPEADEQLPDRGANDVVEEERPTVKFTRSDTLLQQQAADPFQETRYGRQFRYYQRLAGMGGAAAAGCDSSFPIPVESGFSG